MADGNKERVAVNGEVIRRQDPSDRANYQQIVGQLRDFSDSKLKLVEVKPLEKETAATTTIEIKDDPRVNVSNIGQLPLPVYAAKIREARQSSQGVKSSNNPIKFFKKLLFN